MSQKLLKKTKSAAPKNYQLKVLLLELQLMFTNTIILTLIVT